MHRPQLVYVGDLGLPGGYLAEQVVHYARAHAAGKTLAAGLRLYLLEEAHHELDGADVFAQNDEAAPSHNRLDFGRALLTREELLMGFRDAGNCLFADKFAARFYKPTVKLYFRQ